MESIELALGADQDATVADVGRLSGLAESSSQSPPHEYRIVVEVVSRDLAVARSRFRRWPCSERAEVRYGWLRDARGAIREWSRWEATICQAVSFVRTEGLRQNSEWSLLTRLVNRPEAERHRALETELFQFVRAQSSDLGASEVLVGSTEVLESLFGKWKALERQESKSGMTRKASGVRDRKDCWTTAGTVAGSRITTFQSAKTFWTRTVTRAEHCDPTLPTECRVVSVGGGRVPP